MSPAQVESFIERISTKAIDSYISKVASTKEEQLLSKNQVAKLLKVGAPTVNKLLLDGKLTMHSNGKVLKSSIDNYLKSC